MAGSLIKNPGSVSARDVVVADGDTWTSRLPQTLVRAPGSYGQKNNQLEAGSDAEAIRMFLDEVPGSVHTRRAYEREILRCCVWAQATRDRSLSDLTRADWQDYVAYLQSPVSATDRMRRKPLTHQSLKTALAALNSVLDYFVRADYLTVNTLSSLKIHAPKRADEERIERILPEGAIPFLFDYLDELSDQGKKQKKHAMRMRFLMSIAYGLALRSSDLVTLRWWDFQPVQRKGETQWWVNLHGKGNKMATLPVSDELMTILFEYREYLGRHEVPLDRDDGHVCLSLNGTKPMTYSGLYKAFGEFLGQAAAVMDERNIPHADAVRACSPHWLRHTFITDGLDAGIAMRTMTRYARHAKLATTQVYDHKSRDSLYKEMVENSPLNTLSKIHDENVD